MNDNGERHGDELRLVPASTIEPRPVKWIRDERIPLAMVAVIAGETGYGKSTIALELAARVTCGQADGDLDRPRNVVVATAEDAWHEVAVPRLIAAGADLDRVWFVEVTRDGYAELMTLPDDTNRLRDAVQTNDAALVIVDPIAAHMDEHVDSHRDASVRRVLGRLQVLASETGAAVLVVAHFSKGGDSGRAVSRISGSAAFGNAPRSVLVALPQSPETPGERALYLAKSNVAPEVEALGYRIEGTWIDHHGSRIRTSRVVWTGPVDGTAEDALGSGPRVRPVHEAQAFLNDALADGRQPSEDVKRWADEEGISLRTLHRARVERGVIVERSRERNAPTYWRLPD